jgi:hypothetical protein
MSSRRLCTLATLGFALVVMLPSAGRSEGSPVALPRSFYEIQAGPAGGAVWQGRIPNTRLPDGWRPTLVYLPPSVSSRQRYPVVYLLQGFPGSPYEYAYGLQLANLADELVTAHQLPRSSPSSLRQG